MKNEFPSICFVRKRLCFLLNYFKSWTYLTSHESCRNLRIMCTFIKSCLTALRCCYFTAHKLTHFRQMKVRVKLIQPETFVASFLHSLVFIFKVFTPVLCYILNEKVRYLSLSSLFFSLISIRESCQYLGGLFPYE